MAMSAHAMLLNGSACLCGRRSVDTARNTRCASRQQPFSAALVQVPLRHRQNINGNATTWTHRLRIQAATGAGEVDVDVESDAMERMDKSLEAVKRSFASVRTGRANPAMLDRIEVDYYGTPTPLKTIAGVSVPEASSLLIQPYDTSAIQAIEKAIQQSDLGITPSNDGKLIRLNIPALTVERRKEMTKTVSKLGEEGKVAIRNVRRDAMKVVEKLQKDKAIGEDESKDLEAAVQKLTDEYVKEVEKLVKTKTEELTKV